MLLFADEDSLGEDTRESLQSFEKLHQSTSSFHRIKSSAWHFSSMENLPLPAIRHPYQP